MCLPRTRRTTKLPVALRCFVTGATGFIGSHLVRRLLRKGHRVAALIRPGANTSRLTDCLGEIEVVKGSLDQIASFASQIHSKSFDAVFHLAWAGVTAGHRNDPKQITWNINRSLELWSLLQASGSGTWISVGSQAEYGLQSGVVREDTPATPVTAYGTAKLALSLLTGHLCSMVGMRLVWLRLFSTYGPDDDDDHMVPSLIRALLRGERYALTSGEQIWDFLYIDDVISAMMAAAELEHVRGVFNLASGNPGRLCDFFTLVRDSIDKGLSLGIGDLAYRPDQIMHLEGDATRFREASGWAPSIEWPEGVRATVDWYKMKANHVYE